MMVQEKKERKKKRKKEKREKKKREREKGSHVLKRIHKGGEIIQKKFPSTIYHSLYPYMCTS
jgi:hypothetical protein